MKNIHLFIVMFAFANFLTAQTEISVYNPNNTSANLKLDWLNNVARIRIGGSGVGATNGLDIQTIGNVSLMRFLRNGNVGIGVNPTSRLHVFNGNILLEFEKTSETDQGNNFLYKGIQFKTDNANAFSSIRLYRGSHSYRLGLRFQTMNSATFTPIDAMSILPNGNVGIGENSPSAKLDVAGKIEAEEIEVTLASMQDLNLNGTLAANNITYTANGQTADHVFEADYNLRSLEEIEVFILENKHLPDVPSAAVMEEEGVNLAEMNKLLLQKVEELTLHLIEKDKEIDKLKIEQKAEMLSRKEMSERLIEIEKLLKKQ
nr:hypothetical protein [uncultured Carboxylicivirga sp.]